MSDHRSKEIFFAARDGNLRRLKRLTADGSKEGVSELVNRLVEGSTALIIAAKGGHLECVRHLVDTCGAPVAQVGSIEFDRETIDGAPALWVAAAAGHLNVAAFLVARGANVNSTTRSNSTPLRAACYDGHMAIVQYLVEHKADIEIANRHGHTCLMIACYKGHYNIADYLVRLGADINRKSVKGNTALHDCAESGSLAIMQRLLGNGAKCDVDSYGMTPLLAAAVTGHSHIVEHLVSRRDLVTPRQKIDALELLGATYVDKKRDLFRAKRLWLEALVERCAEDVNYTKPSLLPNPAYNYAAEVTSCDQLDEVAAEPDQMRMQALLVRERVLGPAHPDTSYYIRYRGAVYADSGNFTRCTTLWMYALDMQQQILDCLSPMTQSSFVSFTELFAFMLNDGERSRDALVSNFTDVLLVLEKAINEIERGLAFLQRPFVGSKGTGISTAGRSNGSVGSPPNGGNWSNCGQSPDSLSTNEVVASNSGFSVSNRYAGNTIERGCTDLRRTVMVTLQIIYLATKLYNYISKEQHQRIHEIVYRLVKLNPRISNKWTLLHIACSTETMSTVGRNPVCIFPNKEVVEILLKVGADAMASDDKRNSPLHVLANTKCPQGIFDLLIEYGAHYDACNNDGRTFQSIVDSNSKSIRVECTDVKPVKLMSLQCLAATALQKTPHLQLPRMHSRIKKFVEMHGPSRPCENGPIYSSSLKTTFGRKLARSSSIANNFL